MGLHEVRVGGVAIGGPLGSRPGLLVGSLFYDRHSIVTDPHAGEFDHARALALLQAATRSAERTGMPIAVDVIAASPRAMRRYLPFAADACPLPLMINGSEAGVRLAGLKAAAEGGFLDRCLYASLTLDTDEEELSVLSGYPPAAVVVLANDGVDPTPEGACRRIEETFVPMLGAIGVAVPVVDLGAMDPPSLGLCVRGITAVWERFGFPAGCAFSNSIPLWTGLPSLGREYVNYSLAAALVACRAAGGDFLHYGPIEKTRVAAHVAGSAEVFYGFAARELDGATLSQRHPLWRMSRLTPDDPV